MNKIGTHQPGAYRVMPRNDLQLKTKTERRDGELFSTLSAARKAAKSGMAIVREADGEVVSIK